MGVAIAIAFTPIGVVPPGVKSGVTCPGVALGVILGVMLGVIAEGVALDGVSSQRDLLFDAPGVDSGTTLSLVPLSGLGVSAQPL